jgi:hypothetical protein
LRAHEIPGVPGVLTPAQCLQTAESIAATQEPTGALPWFDGGHTDPWDHVENAMALTVAGLWEPARAAYGWCRNVQRADGSFPIQLRNGVVEDGNSDSNFCAYVATGVWHHVLITRDRAFAEAMWPVVSQAIDFVLTMQLDGGEIAWARSDSGILPEALLTGCARTLTPWSGTTRCSVVQCAAPQPGHASTLAGTSSWCLASASAASTTGRG